MDHFTLGRFFAGFKDRVSSVILLHNPGIINLHSDKILFRQRMRGYCFHVLSKGFNYLSCLINLPRECFQDLIFQTELLCLVV